MYGCLSPCSVPKKRKLHYDCHTKRGELPEDAWRAILSRCSGKQVALLSLVSKNFKELTSETWIWKNLCLQRKVCVPEHVGSGEPKGGWRLAYALFQKLVSNKPSAMTSTLQTLSSANSIDWIRLGMFEVTDSELYVTDSITAVDLPQRNQTTPRRGKVSTDFPNHTFLSVRSGWWLAELHLRKCDQCESTSCEGTTQALELRHIDLYLFEDEYRTADLQWSRPVLEWRSPSCERIFTGCFDGQKLKAAETRGAFLLENWPSWDEFQRAPFGRILKTGAATITNVFPGNNGFKSLIRQISAKGAVRGVSIEVRLT